MGLRAYSQSAAVCIVDDCGSVGGIPVGGGSRGSGGREGRSSAEDGLPLRNRPKRARHTAGPWNAARRTQASGAGGRRGRAGIEYGGEHGGRCIPV